MARFASRLARSARLHATPALLVDTLGACTELNPVYRPLLKLALEELQLIEQQSAQLDQEMAMLLGHPMTRCGVALPGLGVGPLAGAVAKQSAIVLGQACERNERKIRKKDTRRIKGR